MKVKYFSLLLFLDIIYNSFLCNVKLYLSNLSACQVIGKSLALFDVFNTEIKCRILRVL